MDWEVEAKFDAPDDQLWRWLQRGGQLGPYTVRSKGDAWLRSVYLDTAEWSLLRSGVALRIRSYGAKRRWELTAKWAGRLAGQVHERPEKTVLLDKRPRLPLRQLPPEMVPHLAAVVAGRPLHPVLATHVRRSCFGVYVQPGKRRREVLELAFDRVAVGSGNGKRVLRYREVELELRGGTRRDLRRIAEALRKQFALRPTIASKFERGLRAVYARVPKFVGMERRGARGRHLAAALARLRGEDAAVRLGLEENKLGQLLGCLKNTALLFMRRSGGSFLDPPFALIEALARAQTLLEIAGKTRTKRGSKSCGEACRAEAQRLVDGALNSAAYYTLLVKFERQAQRGGVPRPKKPTRGNG